jgi:tetratricopeptide (TPR) repeat protein
VVRAVFLLAGAIACASAAPAMGQPRAPSLDGVDALIASGKYADALARADAVERLATAGGQTATLARVELTRGAVWQARGFPRPALSRYQHALDIAEQAGLPALVADVYGALASASGDLGQWDRALDFAERQREADPRRTPAAEFRYELQRGIAFSEFHDPDEARSSLQQALEAAMATGDDRSMSTALGETAAIVLDFDHDVAKALAGYDEALKTARRSGLHDLEATWLLDSGAALLERGDYNEARTRLERAIAVERASGARRVTPAALKNLAQVLLHDGRRQEAHAILLTAQREADEQNLQELQWEVRIERAVLAQGDAPAEAERLFGEALDILEEAQGSVLVEQLRTGRLSRTLASVDPYALAIEFLLDRGETSQAFFVAERGRARAFLETLRSAGDEIARALPPKYVELEASVLADISEGQAALRAGQLPAKERRALEAAIGADEDRLNGLRLRLATDRPDVFAVRYPQIWQAEDLRARVLRANQALIMFFLGPTRSACWILDAGALRVVRLPPEPEIEKATREYLQSVSQPGVPAEPALAASLFRLLFPDLSVSPGIDDLIVIPDGILHDLPFESLRDPSGHRLVERYGIEYSPSASSFAVIAGRAVARDRLSSRVLAIGNPVINGREPASNRDGLESVSMLKPVPFTGTELRAIKRLYGRSARVLEGPDATELELREADLSSVSILHFATHGLIDEAQPERSGLVLTARPPGDDGILQMREVYDLRLRDALVTLSACDTALGANVRGEGIIGLSRAFFYAGADAVVASLWSVNDRSTSDFMIEFYKALGQGRSAAAALRLTKLRFLERAGPFRAPYFWAAFIVTGNGSWQGAPAVDQGRNAIVYAIPAAALSLVLLILWRRRSRRFPRRP